MLIIDHIVVKPLVIRQMKERYIYVKICGLLYVNYTYTDGHIRRHLGLLAEMVVYVTMTVMIHGKVYDAVIRLNLIKFVMIKHVKDRFM